MNVGAAGGCPYMAYAAEFAKSGCILMACHVKYKHKQLYAKCAGLLFCPQRREKEGDTYE